MRQRQWKWIASLAVAVILISGMNAGSAFAFKWSKHSGVKGSGDMETRVLEVKDFDEIDLRGGFDIDIKIGNDRELKVTIDDNLWDLFVAEVDAGMLELGWDDDCRPDGDCRIEIVVPSLKVFELHGAGDIDISGLDEKKFELNLRGAGDVEIEGRAKDLKIQLSGAGDIDTTDLKAENVIVRLSGAGNASVYASESIEGRVSGVGNLVYYGDPDERDTHVSGIGHIRRK